MHTTRRLFLRIRRRVRRVGGFAIFRPQFAAAFRGPAAASRRWRNRARASTAWPCARPNCDCIATCRRRACGPSTAAFPGRRSKSAAGRAAQVEWVNQLPERHFLPIDHTLHGAEADKPEVRTVVHVHGAKAPPESDGYPEDWYVPGKSATYLYPNRQEPAMLWYHDHAMGINRLNIYAGLFGLYIVRDAVEDGLNLPRGRYEVPLVICDRLLRKDGSLDYPVSGRPDAPWVPEVFGNAMLVNGKLFPYLDVEPRPYRFRVLNASNGRFYHLSLANGQEFHQIGTDQGLLPAPVRIPSFVLAPGERADVIVDFQGRSGERPVLRSDAFELMQFRVGRAHGRARAGAARGAASGAAHSGIGGRAHARPDPQRGHERRGRIDAHAAERHALAHAGHRKSACSTRSRSGPSSTSRTTRTRSICTWCGSRSSTGVR